MNGSETAKNGLVNFWVAIFTLVEILLMLDLSSHKPFA